MPRLPDYRKLSLNAPPDSMEAILARMEYLYPGSWPPNGLKQLIKREVIDTHNAEVAGLFIGAAAR